MRRLISCILALTLFLSCAWAEDGEKPEYLPQVKTIAQAKDFVDVVDFKNPQALGVKAGRIRHISQGKSNKGFCNDYWRNDEYNFIISKDNKGNKYAYYVVTMCTRAVYCEMLSYFGIDLTPVAMSSMMGTRNIDSPYDDVTTLIPGLVRIASHTYHELDDMLTYYLSNTGYSPIMLSMIYADSSGQHSVLVIGRTESGKLICVDSAYHPVGGSPQFVFTMKLNYNNSKVLVSDVGTYKGASVRACYQWKYNSDGTTPVLLDPSSDEGTPEDAVEVYYEDDGEDPFKD